LPELLIVIAIIGVLASMGLGIMRKAQVDAREAATQSRVEQIESLLQMQLEDYEVRRLPISLREIAAYCNNNMIHADLGGGVEDNLRLDVTNMKRRILMDIINAEMPRPVVDSSTASGFRYNPDVGLFPTTLPGFNNPMGFTEWLDDRFGPTIITRLNGLTSAKVQSWQWIANLPTAQRDTFDLPGEYLYQILARIDIDGSTAIELLGNATIGNSDGDDFLEIVDAWGDPMSLRIWQVDAEEVSTDVWQDIEPSDFEQVDSSTGMPLGYTVIDPTVPREISKIRFEVRSDNLFDTVRN
jgi:prepilin-type N-terminal cleavage/methylation domain-containing protein